MKALLPDTFKTTAVRSNKSAGKTKSRFKPELNNLDQLLGTVDYQVPV